MKKKPIGSNWFFNQVFDLFPSILRSVSYLGKIDCAPNYFASRTGQSDSFFNLCPILPWTLSWQEYYSTRLLFVNNVICYVLFYYIYAMHYQIWDNIILIILHNRVFCMMSYILADIMLSNFALSCVSNVP